ncbi:MAG: porin [Gammaproteobacteria bacterium HGW-Gammaproteobacteria-4]|nr:MAG: porin [Gammaproteobacteria bacterium HGW-Gammaproteobacteria-4]
MALAVGIAAALATPWALAASTPAAQATDTSELAALRAQVAELTRRLDELTQKADTTQVTAQAAQDAAQAADQRTAQLEQQTKTLVATQASATRVVSHLGGYGFANFVAPQNGNSVFSQVGFNPIFHYSYDDKVFFEGELELEAEEDGSTSTALEFANINWLFSDNAMLVAGKFLSPLGNFRQNLHPAWINRFATMPLGFMDGGAAPIADVGLQLRGSFVMGAAGQLNYSGFVTNGPTLEADGDELEAIATEGGTGNADGNFTVGGRVGWLPVPTLEIAGSYARGRVSVTSIDGLEAEDEPTRSYRFYGADLNWQPVKGLDFRAEYARQRAGSAEASIAPDAAVWRTWYTQAAYRFSGTPWELVARYGDFKSNNAMMSGSQFGTGLNYWLTASTVIKAGYEFANPDSPMSTVGDRFIMQLAHGF